MDANKVTTEFIYFHLPEEVKPESIQDPNGTRILNLFHEAKLQDGYNWSAWGRSEEDRNALVWVIANETWFGSNLEWSNEDSTISINELENLACPSPAIVKLRTNLTPTLSSVGGINSAPIVDLTTMPFVAGMSVEDDASTREVLSTMREAVLNKLPEDLAPSYWVMSTWDTRPVVPHPESPTGQNFRSKYIGPVKAKMLSYPEGIVSHVVAVDLKAEKLESIQGDYPQKLHIVVGDVCQENTNIQAVETAIRYGRRLTTLILNAATYRPLGAFPTLSLESWKHTFNINFFSNIHMLQVAWHHLQESSGSVIVTSSRAVLNYLCGCIPLEDCRISSIAITPGAVDTDMQTGLREEGTVSPEVQKFLNALKAEGRLLKPEEPAAAFAKLVETGIPKDLNGRTVYWEDIL
ncbi:hypothetical protein FMUND_250 [Fusarium mundagurra]|uniref:Uncharacterized protein n=1 Tax=Fusarium mundagurra TaxID=1567541 RepID=A0A8H5Z8Z5_9HYPO|nr:hypothetical protein FMUND_250 [Fusarium mundagurra]